MNVKYYLCILCSILISGLLIVIIADVFEFKNFRRLYSRSTDVAYVRKRKERRGLRNLSRGVRQRLAISKHGRNLNPQWCPALRIDSKVRVVDMSRVFGGCRVLMEVAKAEAVSPATEKIKSGFLKPHPISPAMKEFVGASEISRNVAIKMIWEHVKLNKLQVRILSINVSSPLLFRGFDASYRLLGLSIGFYCYPFFCKGALFAICNIPVVGCGNIVSRRTWFHLPQRMDDLGLFFKANIVFYTPIHLFMYLQSYQQFSLQNELPVHVNSMCAGICMLGCYIHLLHHIMASTQHSEEWTLFFRTFHDFPLPSELATKEGYKCCV